MIGTVVVVAPPEGRVVVVRGTVVVTRGLVVVVVVDVAKKISRSTRTRSCSSHSAFKAWYSELAASSSE